MNVAPLAKHIWTSLSSIRPDGGRVTEARLRMTLSCRLTAEISPATLPGSLATAAPDRKCAGPAVGPLHTRRRTFPALNRDCRCNAMSSLRVSLVQLVNPVPSGHDGRQ